MNKTKMIGTLGPSSATYEVIRDMIISGVDVIRINMAYAKFDFARDVILNVRKINNEEKEKQLGHFMRRYNRLSKFKEFNIQPKSEEQLSEVFERFKKSLMEDQR